VLGSTILFSKSSQGIASEVVVGQGTSSSEAVAVELQHLCAAHVIEVYCVSEPPESNRGT